MKHTLTSWIFASIRAAGWAPILVFTLHVVLSRVFGAYGVWQDLDIPMHFAGGVAIGYFCFRSVTCTEARAILGALTPLATKLVSFAMVCTATVLWEFAEWTTDHLGWTGAQKGLDDTILDMALGVVGGLVFLVALARSTRESDER